jgi:glycosyltransferase involved in cell wall biosynthesis
MTLASVLIDLSQFVRAPARSGIQRVLVELISGWPLDRLPACIGYLEGGQYGIVGLETAKLAFKQHFEADIGSAQPGGSAGEMRRRLWEGAIALVPADEIMDRFAAYLIPEPTFHDDVLDMMDRWSSSRPQSTAAIFYDALPQTHPHLFTARHQLGSSRYYRQIAKVENVACISNASLDCLVQRLRRRPILNAIVLPLGARRSAPSSVVSIPPTPTFVSVGTIEPRKNHPVILAAFKELWQGGISCRLQFVGARGWHSEAFFDELSLEAAKNPARFEWIEKANDRQVHDALSRATGAIYVSEEEGFGLPALEALASQCPLIASATLPALDGLPALGQVRLNEVSVESVKAAVQRLSDPDTALQLREEIAQLRLPSWKDFGDKFIEWLVRTLRASAHRPVSLRTERQPLAQHGTEPRKQEP